MELREDEIEALLAFDNAVLTVVHNTDLLQRMGHEYTAIIKSSEITLARASDVRSTAVSDVWRVHAQFMLANHPERVNGYWMYEHAMGSVEVQVIKNRGKHK